MCTAENLIKQDYGRIIEMNQQQDVNNIFKSSYFDLQSSAITYSDIIIVLLVTLLMSLFIYRVYKLTFRGIMYTHSFNVSLVLISMVTSMVILTISTNLILSLGMVGALSIVRFRTAIKDPLDIAFMFWAIAIGLANGALHFEVSLIASLVIASVLYFLKNRNKINKPFLIVMHYEKENHNSIISAIDKTISKYDIKSETISNGKVELTLEVRIKNDNIHEFISTLSEEDNIIDLSAVSYDGEYVS